MIRVVRVWARRLIVPIFIYYGHIRYNSQVILYIVWFCSLSIVLTASGRFIWYFIHVPQSSYTARNVTVTEIPLLWRHSECDGVKNHGPLQVYSTACSSTDQRKRQSSVLLAFVMGIHRWPVNFPYKGPATRKKVSIWWRHNAKSRLEQTPTEYPEMFMFCVRCAQLCEALLLQLLLLLLLLLLFLLLFQRFWLISVSTCRHCFLAISRYLYNHVS